MSVDELAGGSSAEPICTASVYTFIYKVNKKITEIHTNGSKHSAPVTDGNTDGI